MAWKSVCFTTMCVIIRATAAAALCCGLPACDSPESDTTCASATVVRTLPPQLNEASGIAVSHRFPGVLWAHNDSEGTPMLYALDTDGSITAEIDVSDVAAQSDWEDIAVGPCGAGSCIYIGDVGDNLHNRDDRAILRFTEPDPQAADAGDVERFPIRYPDTPEDAEAIFVMPDTSVYVITKGRSDAITVYRYPAPLRADERVTLVPVQTLSEGIAQLPDLVTGASAAPDGQVIAVRTYAALRLFHFDGDTLSQAGQTMDLLELAEPQGEGIAIDSAGRVYLLGETGPLSAPAPFSRLDCRLP